MHAAYVRLIYYITITSRLVLGLATPPSLYYDGGGVVLRMFTSMLFCCVYCSIISYSHTKFQFRNFIIYTVMCKNYYNVWPGAVLTRTTRFAT